MSRILDKLKEAEAERQRIVAERRRLEAEADAALAASEREEVGAKAPAPTPDETAELGPELRAEAARRAQEQLEAERRAARRAQERLEAERAALRAAQERAALRAAARGLPGRSGLAVAIAIALGAGFTLGVFAPRKEPPKVEKLGPVVHPGALPLRLDRDFESFAARPGGPEAK